MAFDRNFVYYLLARVNLSLASTILSVTIGWHLYQATGDPFDLALVGLVQIVPMYLLFIGTGWVVDNFSRKLVLMGCSLLQLAVFVGLGISLHNGVENKYIIFALLSLYGCMRAFLGPALQAVLPNLVREEQLAKAVAISSTAWTAASTAGPFVAGLLLATLDFDTYWLLAGMAAIAFLALSRLPRMKVTEKSQRGFSQLVEGISFVWRNPFVLPSITLDMLILLAGGGDGAASRLCR